jgi:O-antigen ligase
LSRGRFAEVQAGPAFWEQARLNFRTVAGFLLACAIAFALYQYGATQQVDYYRVLLLALIPLALLAWNLPLSSLRNPALLPLFVVGLYLIVNIIGRSSLFGRGYVIACLGWIALSVTLLIAAGDSRMHRRIALFLVIMGGLQAFYGLLQTLGEPNYLMGFTSASARGSFVNHNHFAGLVNMTLPLAIGGFLAALSIRTRKAKNTSEVYAWSWLLLLACSMMGLALMLSLSRMGAMILIINMVFIACLVTFYRGRGAWRRLPVRVIWGMLVIILGLSAWIGVNSMLARFGNVGVDLDTRMEIYHNSLQLIRHHPLSGVGPGMYAWRFRPHQTIDPTILVNHAHNDYIQSAAEWGLPLALGFWAFVFWRLVRVLRVYLGSRDPWKRGLSLGCGASILSVVLHSFVDFNLQIPANLMVFAVILALAWSLEWQPEGHRRRKKGHPMAADLPGMVKA